MPTNLLKFAQGLQSSYDTLKTAVSPNPTIDNNTIYYCTDTNRFFLGTKEFSRPVRVSNVALNTVEGYPPYSLYFNTSIGCLYYNDGTNWNPIFNNTIIAEQFNDIADELDRRKELFYGTCDSAASATTKIVICPEFLSTDLVVGTLMAITFTNTNSGAVASLVIKIKNDASSSTTISKNANGDPIKKHYGENVSNLSVKGELRANETYLFAFDGTNWVCLTLNYNSNTNTLVTQSLLSDNVNKPLLMSYYSTGSTTTTAKEVYRNDTIYANPSTGTITATTFNGALGHTLTIGNIEFDGSSDVSIPVYDGSITPIQQQPS